MARNVRVPKRFKREIQDFSKREYPEYAEDNLIEVHNIAALIISGIVIIISVLVVVVLNKSDVVERKEEPTEQNPK